jgi:hypothetical protein
MRNKITPLILILFFCISPVTAMEIENAYTAEYDDIIVIGITVNEPFVDVQITHDNESGEFRRFRDKIHLSIAKKEDTGRHIIGICIREHNGTEEIEYKVSYMVENERKITAGDIENPPNPYIPEERYEEAVAICGLWTLMFVFALVAYGMGMDSREEILYDKKESIKAQEEEYIEKQKVKPEEKSKDKIEEDRCSYCGTKTENEKRCTYCGGKL